MRPFIVTTIFLIGAGLLLSHFLIPMSNQVKYSFEEEYLIGSVKYEHDVHRELRPDTIYFFHSLYDVKSRCSQFTIEYWKDGRMTKQLISAKAEYFEESDSWNMKLVEYYSYHQDGTLDFRREEELDTVLHVKVEDFGNRPEIIWNMNTPDLTDFIERERGKGAGKIANIEIEKHSRTSNPFSMLVLAIIGFSISTRKVRGGTGVQLMFGLLIGALFVFSSRITTVSAMNLGFSAAIAVWIPNIFFMILALIFYLRAPK
jgi:lipopolysaccharide export system permease protein